ncbi:MAG: hypothetical protein ACRDRT_17780 [Pseudonocardiaceae bacterium]
MANNLEFARMHPENFFWPSVIPNPEQIAERLARTALILKVCPIQIDRFEEWWIVAAQRDWLQIEVRRYDGIPGNYHVNELFDNYVPFPIAGPNSVRGEIIVKAFARDVVIYGLEGEVTIQGECPKLQFLRDYVRSAYHSFRVIAFQMGYAITYSSDGDVVIKGGKTEVQNMSRVIKKLYPRQRIIEQME